MIKIVVDSTADIPADLRDEYGIAVVPVLAQFGRETLRDNIDISRDDFYARLIANEEPPKTAAPPVGMFEEQFRELVADGSEVLSISLAGDLSGTFTAAQQAARLVEGARIVCVDSQTVAMPLTYLAVAAARAAREGRSLDELVALVEKLRSRMVILLALDTLRYLEKGGRIGRVRALLGTMLSVKPILEVRHAQVNPVEQVRTWRRVPPRLVELMQQRGSFEELSVQYTTDRGSAEQLADLCAAAGLMARERIRVVQAGGALGTHVGPGAVALTGMVKA
ncbi:MAG TPA: DegV family protein [Roseiflexaceae bacterium]|nr:DegV family protein [Roseiflexaceae bacterium]